MQRSLPAMLLFTALSAALACANAAEIEIPPPGKPKDLSVYVNQPNCARWTDECVNCSRGHDGNKPVCSNAGFACQPKTIRCVNNDIPQSEPHNK